MSAALYHTPSAREEHRSASSAGTHVPWAGDLLLTFGDGGDPLPHRTDAAVDAAAAGADWQLAIQSPGPGWKGMPVAYWDAGNWEAWLVGEFYGLGRRAPADLLASILAERRAPSELNGHFLLLARHRTSQQWHVWTDRFGTLHAYYGHAGCRAAVGTFSPAVASFVGARRVDWSGLSGFFAFGFFTEDRTFFEEVRILQPASHYVFDAQGRLVRQARYWDWTFTPDPGRSYDDTIDAFAECLGEVMDDHTRAGRVVLPLSGGLDSRSTLAALEHPERLSEAFSYGYTKKSVETRIARRLATRRGIPLRRSVVGPYLFDDLDRVGAATEGFQDVTQPRQASIVDARAPVADFVIAAHWGDVWLDEMGVEATASPEAVHAQALGKMTKDGSAWLLENVCRPQLRGEGPARITSDAVATALEAYASIADADFRLKAFKTDQWSFRWTLASLRTYQHAAFPRLTFYDTRLADFFTTVPSSYMQGRKLQIDYLKRHAPDLARVKWQRYDADLYWYRYFDTLLVPRRALKKARRLLRREQVIQRNWEVQFLNERGRRGLDRWLLEGGLRLHDYVAREAVRALLQSFYGKPTGANGYTVSMLLTFSAWLEQYGRT